MSMRRNGGEANLAPVFPAKGEARLDVALQQPMTKRVRAHHSSGDATLLVPSIFTDTPHAGVSFHGTGSQRQGRGIVLKR